MPLAPENRRDSEPALRALRPWLPKGDRELSPPTPGYAVSALSHRGCVRPDNHDQFLVAELERSMRVVSTSIEAAMGDRIDAPPGLLVAVADGLGGVQGSEVASCVAIDALVQHAVEAVPWIGATWSSTPDVASGLRRALEGCQERIRVLAGRRGLDVRMGTTLTAAYITWPLAHIVHVGDSRCYLYRDGRLLRLTRDQTLAQQLVDAGEMDEDEVSSSPLRSRLTSVIGGTSEFDLEIHPVALESRDVLLLCTDGLYEELRDSQIRKVLARVHSSDDLDRCVEQLISEALKAGGHDNITAAVVALG